MVDLENRDVRSRRSFDRNLVSRGGGNDVALHVSRRAHAVFSRWSFLVSELLCKAQDVEARTKRKASGDNANFQNA